MTMKRMGFVWMAAALAVAAVTGCATKNYVRNQTAPIIQHAGQLNNATAENSRRIHDVDQRAQAGIQKAQSAADTANQNAQTAGQQAATAQTAANDAVTRADSLSSVVKGLDNYKQVAKVSVHFAFNKAVLTTDDKEKLDSFAQQLTNAQNFILEVTGGTDSAGPALYNDELSNRRADAAVQYLVTKYNIAPRRFYVIGVGKDQYVASNRTAAGRRENRRVTIQMLSNMSSTSSATASTGSVQSNQPAQTAQTTAAPE